MEKSLTKNLMAIVMRNGIEIWAEEEKIRNLQRILTIGKESKFIEIDGETINTADIIGIFLPKTMEELVRRKNGQWKCSWGNWHEKGERNCGCGEWERYKSYDTNNPRI